MKIIYEAYDGKQFDNKYNCELYENKSKDKTKAEEILATIKEICDKCSHCSECPFEVSNEGCVFKIDDLNLPYKFLDYFKGL